ncbi:MAG: hypothetical protein AAF652_08605 [Cyanobacteria bacterium P01_C01_bin.72]
MKLIQKIGKAKFKVSTPGVTGGDLELDFNPVIEQFNLKGNFCLIHWQARPKGHREWGVYSSKDDSYQSQEKLKLNITVAESLQLDDTQAKTIPSAVFYTGEDKITCINEKTILGEVFLSDLAN